MNTVFKCNQFLKLFTIATRKLKKPIYLSMLHQNNIIINYNQCHMIIKKFVYDFIKLLKSDNLFLNSLLIFQFKNY